MSDLNVYCVTCGGIKQGPLGRDEAVCGAAVPDVPEARGLKRTQCDRPRRSAERDAEGLYVTDTERYVEVRCRMCGWLHLIAPRERDHPCEAVQPCSGKVSDPEDRTFECVPQGFTKRVAELLKRIEWNAERETYDTIGRACPCCDGWSGGPDLGHEEDCELAALLKEFGA